jgi:hypothetical protein
MSALTLQASSDKGDRLMPTAFDSCAVMPALVAGIRVLKGV